MRFFRASRNRREAGNGLPYRISRGRDRRRASPRHQSRMRAALRNGVPMGHAHGEHGRSLVMGLLAAWFAFRAGTGLTQRARLFLTTGVLGGSRRFQRSPSMSSCSMGAANSACADLRACFGQALDQLAVGIDCVLELFEHRSAGRCSARGAIFGLRPRFVGADAPIAAPCLLRVVWALADAVPFGYGPQPNQRRAFSDSTE